MSMAERAAVDLDFMSELTGMEKDKLISELKGLIYQDPGGNPAPYEKWQTADEYLSGDVRQKLRAAEAAVEFLGVLHHEKQALVVLAFGNLLSRLLLFYDLDIVFLGQIAQSLGV